MNRTHHHHAGLRFAVGETGQGRPFVFQHGLCGDATQPADVAADLDGWRCLTLECRAHGQSEAGAAEHFSIAQFTGDVVSLIERRALGPVVVGGISMGAAIALRLAVTRPDLVTALVLARPAWVTRSAPVNLAPNALAGELLRAGPPEEARARFLASDTAARLRARAPDNLASLLGFFARQPVADTAELLCRIPADGPGVTVEAVRGVRRPPRVLGHGRAVLPPLPDARPLAGLIPGARLVQICPKADDPAAHRREFRVALATFLRELAP